jgi:hypothetical protein
MNAQNMTPVVVTSSGNINIPTYCEIIGEKVNKTVIPPGTPITDLVYDPNAINNCENKVLSVQVFKDLLFILLLLLLLLSQN